MPSRKSESSDAQPDSRRSSLHRIGSLASFQALNPFARRRSNNTAGSIAASSSSNLSLSSTTPNAPMPNLPTSSSQSSQTEDEITALPTPPVPAQPASRRSSYICIPDDPIGGMPRSRTFSNLPLPTRARRGNSIAASKSHSRLPSAVLPSSRIPTPPISNRKHSTSRLATAGSKQPLIRNRAKRSDTEPLLPMKNDYSQASNTGRSTAFKENLSLSPVKPLPPMFDDRDFYGSALPSRAYASRHGWPGQEAREPLLPHSFSSSLSVPGQAPVAGAKQPQSSPAYRSSYDRQQTPSASRPGPAQRWNSQPVLTNLTNRQSSRHTEIKERRLLSEVQPVPPPPPPKTPSTAHALTGSRLKALNNSSHLRQASEQKPFLSKLSNKPRAQSPKRSTQEVSKPEPTAYWCGRFSALNDRYRNEELSIHLNSTKAESDKMHSPEANTKRMRRALEHLHSLCTTQEARESFVVFQLQFAALQGNPELSRPMQLNLPEKKIVLSREPSVESEDAGSEARMSESRKMSFMDRLLGRGKKVQV